MQLAAGTVADRPWGKTLAALALRGVTGQLALQSPEGKKFQIAFAEGAVVAAASPLASDAAVRVALTGSLISSTQVADIARRQAAAPTRDEIDVLAEAAKLAPEQALRLRRRIVAQRAARTFSIDRGAFVVEDAVTLPVTEGTALDARAIIYLGARQNLSEPRLASELAILGGWFRLQPDATPDLPQFGFSSTERAVLEHLAGGATVAELTAAATAIDPRTIHALVYALAACGACECRPLSQAPSSPLPIGAVRARIPSPPGTQPIRRPTQTPSSGSGPIQRPRPETLSSSSARAASVRTASSQEPRRRAPTSRPPATGRRRADEGQASDVRSLIAQRLAVLDAGADHFALLGVGETASPDEVRKAYFGLARRLHPDRLAALQIVDREAQRLFAQINTAFAILQDPKRRLDYVQILRRGGEAAVRADQARAEEVAQRVIDAEEAFRRGEAALRRDQIQTAIAELTRAIALNTDEPDYHALLSWAQFCAAPDKLAAASPTRTALEHAIAASPRATTARFYLGRVERMLGRDREALVHFQEVLRFHPAHAEAAAEVRVIEARLAAGPDKGGLFGKLKR
ncbi:MAG TPA: J domain-containing protein [Kofleriaceae bacterium]|jgi:hypothetical protein